MKSSGNIYEDIFVVAIAFAILRLLYVLMERFRNKKQARTIVEKQQSTIERNPSGDIVKRVESRFTNDHYAQALVEFESKERQMGLWAKCYADEKGDESRAKAAYIGARANEIANSK